MERENKNMNRNTNDLKTIDEYAKRLSYYGEKKHQYEPEYTNDNRI